MNKFTVIATLLLLCACSLTAPPVSAPTRPAPVPPAGSAPRLPAPAPVPQQTTPAVSEPSSVAEPESLPAPRQYTLTPASKALVTQAQSQAGTRDYALAASTLERALRIEPRNPLLWLELGKVRQAGGNHAQAESTARKALSLATGDLRLQATAWNLIAASLRARGKGPEAAEAAERAAALMPD